ncbi:diphosphomevalonate decarboxylase [Enterococcus dongliensis]|uniref:diphosphomevalonate decarboxylase n=1 Tax=Enterococcus dongliensis TaxID=2559925 RepID=A0AAP5U1S3_9ENTE|nr:diphosphomevalonate decarboxylase [Enterococcus dongliensis]MDT2596211.1 diphosphomevalonate decarboxylase [Enterococcus dongliensis]MDT2603932.1 diphosphomevalonate decarboxylase [Enterococcus dongliensis]MDT2634172.1 diphosphomevalonate decarboxylase [Enterococcus dongliensis]MDT2637102.1 diphosphomevalonate decarboxylase [Enterococcus dongliensis]MDT2642485.1 diphosphomevalonate decarboxylase [Enterococcus dongliensis]
MFSGKARAYTNIALIKYWGKEDQELIIPMNNSLSLTLDAFYTETQVIFSEEISEDRFYLDNQLQDSKATVKVSRFLDLVRSKAHCNLSAVVQSQNFVPTAAGLASSASGLAALAGAASAALKLDLAPEELSRLARRGSGSACRSIYGGFAEWQKGDSDKTSHAVKIPSAGFENDLSMIFVVVNDSKKDISSRDGMQRTVETSAFYPGWLTSVPQDLAKAKKAIAEKDFVALGEVTEASALKMHGTTLAANPPFTYWSAESLQVMNLVRQIRNNGLACYFTMDAGPNVKILVERKNETALLQALNSHIATQQLVVAHAGPAIKILTEANGTASTF